MKDDAIALTCPLSVPTNKTAFDLRSDAIEDNDHDDVSGSRATGNVDGINQSSSADGENEDSDPGEPESSSNEFDVQDVPD